MIIDAHAHMYRNPKDLDRMVKSGIIEQVWLLDLSFYGDFVKRHWEKQSATQEEILEVAKEYRGFFIPFGYLDFRKPPEIVEELHSRGFIGLKAILPPKPYDDFSYFPYYERAEKLKMPILFHTGTIAPLPYKYKEDPKGLGKSSTNSRPTTLYAIAHSFPELTLIGAHLGFPWISEETVKVIQATPNVYFDFSAVYRVASKWLIEHLHYSTPLSDGTFGGFSDKILMAIDSSYGSKKSHDRIFEAIKYWELFFKFHSQWYTWGKDVDKIMRGNARKIMSKIVNQAERKR